MIIDSTAADVIDAYQRQPLAAIVMKFDPTKKLLTNASENLHFSTGAREVNSYEVIDAATDLSTWLQPLSNPFFELISSNGTAIDQKKLWPRIPKYFDYVEVESFYDADEIEEILLQKINRQGW